MVRASGKRLIVILFLLTFSYTIAAIYYPNPDVLICVRSFQVCTSISVVIRFRKALLEVWREWENSSDEALMTTAIVIAYSSMGLGASWLLLWRGALEPTWMPDAAINGYFVIISAWAALIYTVAPGSKGGRLGQDTFSYVGWTLAATVVLSVIFLSFHGFFVEISEVLKPFMAEAPHQP